LPIPNIDLRNTAFQNSLFSTFPILFFGKILQCFQFNHYLFPITISLYFLNSWSCCMGVLIHILVQLPPSHCLVLKQYFFLCSFFFFFFHVLHVTFQYYWSYQFYFKSTRAHYLLPKSKNIVYRMHRAGIFTSFFFCKILLISV
jgi:hypothetical protein